MSALRPKADAQSARVRIELMSAFPKADIQNVRDRVELYVRLWPIADIGRQLICRVMYISSHIWGEPFESLLSI